MANTVDISVIMTDKRIEAIRRPSYQSAISDSPPSYKTLFGDIKKAKQQSHGNVDFARNAWALCSMAAGGSVAVIIFIILGAAIPFSMVVIGGKYIGDCPAERYIPIYLVVSGSFGLFVLLLKMVVDAKNYRDKKKGETEPNGIPCIAGLYSLICCFSLAWFIAGNVWIYRTHGEWSEDPTALNYCHPTLYYFAFWMITGMYILVGTLMVLSCCLGFIAACCGKD